MEKEKIKDFEIRRISKELGEIIDNQKEKIDTYAWNALKISDKEASKVVARKYKNAGLDK